MSKRLTIEFPDDYDVALCKCGSRSLKLEGNDILCMGCWNKIEEKKIQVYIVHTRVTKTDIQIGRPRLKKKKVSKK